MYIVKMHCSKYGNTQYGEGRDFDTALDNAKESFAHDESPALVDVWRAEIIGFDRHETYVLKD